MKLIVAALTLALFAHTVNAQTNDLDMTKRELAAESKIQEAFDRLYKHKSDEQFELDLAVLRKLPKEEIMRQIVVFDTRPDLPRGASEMMMVLPSLLGFEREDVEMSVEVFADYLETPNEDQRNRMQYKWVDHAAEADIEGPSTLRKYQQFLEERRSVGKPLPAGLIRRMYEISPNQAMFRMCELYKAEHEVYREIRLADHVVEDVLWRQAWGYEIDAAAVNRAKAELEKLAASPQWWVRLYVAEMSRPHAYGIEAEQRNPNILYTSALVEKLSKDENELVRRAMTDERKN